MFRMISVFVRGLLPDFFAISTPSKQWKNCVRQDPHRAKKRPERPNRTPIRRPENEIATRKTGAIARNTLFFPLGGGFGGVPAGLV
jgi:hypothetical protein